MTPLGGNGLGTMTDPPDGRGESRCRVYPPASVRIVAPRFWQGSAASYSANGVIVSTVVTMLWMLPILTPVWSSIITIT